MNLSALPALTPPLEKDNYTYILRCCDGSLYCGWTCDLAHRLAVHNSGKGGKYTRSHLPAELVWYTASSSKENAMSLESKIKKLTRKQKLMLVCGESSLEELF